MAIVSQIPINYKAMIVVMGDRRSKQSNNTKIFFLNLHHTHSNMPSSPESPEPSARWSLAIHGGAGVISKSLDYDIRFEFEDGLRQALQAGQAVLQSGGTALDATEAAVRHMEDNPLFNAGRGAVFTHAGTHEN